MNDITNLHRDAMQKAEEAVIIRMQGNEQGAKSLFIEAFKLEFSAALGVGEEGEPSRSVLLRSAGSLALQAELFREAEIAVAEGLTGNPPPEIAEELRNLLEQVYFHRHLDLQGIKLGESQIQLSIAGKAIGYGFALSDEILERVEALQKIVYRTVERLNNIEFKETPDKKVRKQYGLFLSASRPASFAVTIHLGRPSKQIALPGINDSKEIFDEIFDNMKLINDANEEAVKRTFADEAYYRNFLGLAKNIAPDGEDVSLVGLTSVRFGKEKRVELTRPSSKISFSESQLLRKAEESSSKKVEITGSLLWADATAEETGKIKLIDEEGIQHSIIVPTGMMADIVKPLWEDSVTVTGVERRRGRGVVIYLEDIVKTSE
jgi:hypothetical protein